MIERIKKYSMFVPKNVMHYSALKTSEIDMIFTALNCVRDAHSLEVSLCKDVINTTTKSVVDLV